MPGAPKDANIVCKLCFPTLPVYAHSGMKQPDCAMATILGCWYTMFCWKPEGERIVTFTRVQIVLLPLGRRGRQRALGRHDADRPGVLP